MAGDDDAYPCVGICLADSEGTCCLGCGRPLLPAQADDADDIPAATAPAPDHERPAS